MNIYRLIVAMMLLVMNQQVYSSQQDQHVFEEGNQFYAKNNYDKAFASYQQIKNKGFVVLYNMSLCSFLQHKNVTAILYALRAERQARSYQEFSLIEKLFNFKVENEENADRKIDESWFEQIAVFSRKCILTIPLVWMQILVLLGFIVLIVCWYMMWYKKNIIRSILLLFGWCIAYSVLLYKIDFIEQKLGVVKKTIPIFAGPDVSFYKKTDIDVGQVVKIIDQRDIFYKIDANKNVGWVDRHYIELV